MKLGKIVAFVFMFIMLMVTQLLIAVYPLTRTYSISPDSLHQIRAAAGLVDGEPSDGLITKYWETYTRTYRNDSPDPGDLQRDRSYTDSFGFEGKAIHTFTAVLDYNSDEITYARHLDDIRNYLFSFPWDIYQNALKDQNYYPGDLPGMVPTEWDDNPYPGGTDGDQAWWQLTDYQRAREMSYNLILMSYIVDMLYYAHDRMNTTSIAYTQFESILVNLQAHMTWIHETFFNYGLPNSPGNGWATRGWNIFDLYATLDSSMVAPVGMCYDNNGDGGGVKLPSLANSVSRFHVICGLGYASILTGQDTFLNTFVKNEFKSTYPLPADTPFYGFNDYLTTNSGMFIGGLTYQNRFFYMSNLFLTALKRTKGINLYNSTNAWNCDMIPRMVRYTLRRIDPELHHITFGDDWRYNGIESDGDPNTNMNHSIQIERGLLSFYYQNTDDPESHDNIRWYVSALKNSANNTSGNWPRETYEHDFSSSFETVMNYQSTTHGGPASVTTGGSLPSYISQGTYSNSESTILRSPTSSYSGYSASHMLVVNHENSFVPYHNNDDNTAFQFYLWGKPVIVEPGYVPYILGQAKYWDWYQSPFSQNLLLINPASPVRAPRIDEAAYLSKTADVVANFNLKYEDPMNFYSWPISWLSRIQETRPYYNKASKQFLLRNIISSVNYNIEHLRIHFKYNNSRTNSFEPTPADIGYNNQDNPCHVFRNFYKVSDKYFIVLDKAIFEETQSINNVFRNQMNCLIDLRTSSGNVHNTLRSAVQNPGQPGIYQYIMSANKNMFIAMGSSIDGVNSYSISNSDSTKLAWTPHDWSSLGGSRIGSMKKLSITASSPNNQERFITLLYPSENLISYNPITEAVHDDSGYRVAVTEGTRKVFVSLCTEPILVFPNENYRWDTDGDMFVLDAESNLSSVYEMILSQGTILTAAPNVGYAFPTQEVFRSYSAGLDEVIASWTGGNLHVTFKTNQEIYPQYKIKRCEVSPSHFFSKTEFGFEPNYMGGTATIPRGTIADNIVNLAYDDDYFYVNYALADLIQEGLLTADCYIYCGTYNAIDVPDLLQFKGGPLQFIGDWHVGESSTMRILGDSNIDFYQFNITVDGTLEINTTGTNPIEPLGHWLISITGTMRILGNSEFILPHNFLFPVAGTLEIIGSDKDHRCSLSSINSMTWWEGIEVMNGGQLSLKHCEINNAKALLINGAIVCDSVLINRSDLGLRLINAESSQITNSTIQNGLVLGVLFQDCFHDGSRNVFINNRVSLNNFGLAFCNSSPVIKSCWIDNNTSAGIICTYNANPVIMESIITDTCGHTAQNNQFNYDNPEIKLYSDCFPMLYHNDIIFGDGYSLLNFDSNPDPYNIPYNWWGTLDLGTIAQSIFPANWEVTFTPTMLESITSGGANGLVPSYFETALDNELNNNLYEARNMYRTIIENYPTNAVAQTAASRLVCIADTDEELDLAKDFLNGIYELYPSTKIANAAYLDSLMCETLLKNYSTAIDGYYQKLSTCTTYIDSIFTYLEIIYTYLQAEANSPKSISQNIICMGVPITNSKQAKEMAETLFNIALSNQSSEPVVYHIPEVITVLNNYPNPFNPSTTVSFSIPKTSKCELVVYNTKGQAVKHMVNETKDRGIYNFIWNSDDDNGKRVSSGVYFFRLNVDGKPSTKKMLLLK